MKTHFVKIDQPFINTIVQDVLKIQIFGIAKYLAKKKKKEPIKGQVQESR